MHNVRKAGFSLFEVLIAVAIVAVVSVAIGVPVVRSLNKGKAARAQSDAQVIGSAILEFYKDVGQWPAQADRDPNPEAWRLVGNYSLGGGNNGIPGGNAKVSGASGWCKEGHALTLTEQLVRNRQGKLRTLYAESANPQSVPGWNGPYLDRVPLDPWGRPYVVNIGHAHPAVAGSRTSDNDYHNVMVLSAGRNGIFETPHDAKTYDEQPGGDDIGFVIRGATRFE